VTAKGLKLLLLSLLVLWKTITYSIYCDMKAYIHIVLIFILVFSLSVCLSLSLCADGHYQFLSQQYVSLPLLL